MDKKEAYEKKKKQWEEFEKQEKVRLLKEGLKNCGIPVSLYSKWKNTKLITTSENRNTLLAVKRWWESEEKKPFLLLYGNYGTGKTLLAGKIAVKQFDKNRQVYFTTKKDFDLSITNFNEDVNDFIQHLKEIELLVIDDILSGYLTDYRFSQLFSILDYRYLTEKLTVITSNENLLEYKSSNADWERLKDRLHEVAETVYFGFESFRRKDKKNPSKEGGKGEKV